MRSATGRRAGVSRVYSLNPVTLPTNHLTLRVHRSGMRREDTRGNSRNAQHAFVLVREHLDEFGKHRVPVLQNPSGLRTIGELRMPRNQRLQRLDIFASV